MEPLIDGTNMTPTPVNQVELEHTGISSESKVNGLKKYQGVTAAETLDGS
jgi:hypothetical protein